MSKGTSIQDVYFVFCASLFFTPLFTSEVNVIVCIIKSTLCSLVFCLLILLLLCFCCLIEFCVLLF